MADAYVGTRSTPQESQTQDSAGDARLKEEADVRLAETLSGTIEDANERVVPIVDRIREKIEKFEAQKPEDRSEDELVKELRPLLENAEKILNETNGAIHGASPNPDQTKRLQKQAQRNLSDHTAQPHEQRLAQALKVMVEKVQGTIDWAKAKLEAYPKAKKELSPLLLALSQPITQIVGGVGLLLGGVLNLLNNLLGGIGLGGLLPGIFAATGLQQVYKGLGLDKWLNPSTGRN